MPATGAQVPLALSFSDLDGSSHTLGEVIGNRPALLIIADYRCTQLCGSVLGIAARALSGRWPLARVAITLSSWSGSIPRPVQPTARPCATQELAAYPEVEG